MLEFPVTMWVDLFHLRGKQNKTKHGGGFLSQEEDSPIMGFTACGSGHLGAFLQPAGPLGRRAPRWKSLSHFPARTRCGSSGRYSGHMGPAEGTRTPSPSPCSSLLVGGGGPGQAGQVPGEIASLTCPGARHTSQGTGKEGDTAQLARAPVSGGLEMPVCPGMADAAGEGV